MVVQRVLARRIHWAVLAYSVVCWGATLWLVGDQWPIVAPDRRSMHPAALTFLMTNIVMRVLCTPSEARAIKFWSGLFRFGPRTVRAARRFLDVAFSAILVAVGGLIAWRFFSPETVTNDVKHAAFNAGAVVLLLYPALRLAALAAAGREVVYVLTEDEHETLANEHRI